MERLWRTSHISGGNAAYVEQLYDNFLADPQSVPEKWREYFSQLPSLEFTGEDVSHQQIKTYFEQLGKTKKRVVAQVDNSYSGEATEYERKQVSVVQLISAFRQRGHQHANLDPLGLWKRESVRDLELGFHQLSEAK